MNGLVPLANYAHPSLTESEVAFARQWMRTRPHETFVLLRALRDGFVASEDDAAAPVDVQVKHRRFTARKCVGPAPFVGDPVFQKAFHVWYVASDEHGVGVASDSEMRIVESYG